MNDIDTDDPNAIAQVTAWANNPFEPFVIARGRRTAFKKYVFMAYLDNLIAWGDQLYGQVDTIESINQATQLYVLVSDLLGELPEQIPPPDNQPELRLRAAPGTTRRVLELHRAARERVPVRRPASRHLRARHQRACCGLSKTLFFCIPQNQQLLQYWATVAEPPVQHPPLPEHPGRAADSWHCSSRPPTRCC